MNMSGAFLLIILAGIINGSFALPIKYLNHWRIENIFLIYALLSFVTLPWILALFMMPQIFAIYASASIKTLCIMFIGGFIFGLGQICFALALNFIDLGLGFVINLGLATILGCILPLVFLHPHQIFSKCGLLAISGSLIAAVGLLFLNHAGSLHNEKNQEHKNTIFFKTGVILTIFAGTSSAGQNFSFALTGALQDAAFNMGAPAFGSANIIWPGFLICSFIPYAFYMIYLNVKNNTYRNYSMDRSGRYYLFALVMALFWYGSILLYSKATQLIGDLGPVVGWPLFIVMALLTSTFWGWRHKEWKGWSKRVELAFGVGIGFLILGVILLGVSSRFA